MSLAAPLRPATSGPSWRQATGAWLPACLLMLAVLVAWEVVVRVFSISSYVVPAPSAIWIVLLRERDALASASLVTAREILIGFVASGLVGIALAVVITRFDWLGRALYPLVVLFQNVPKVALAPLFILWFGYDLAPKIGLIVVIAFFPVTLSMLAGMQSADPALIALLRSVGANPTEILLKVQVPQSLPNLLAGLKIAATFSVIGAIVGEFAGASAGLGYMIQFASTQLDTALVFAALVAVSILGVGFYYAVEWLERLAVPWAPRFKTG